MDFKYLTSGIDTVECAYYLMTISGVGLDFDWLAFEKEQLRQVKGKPTKIIELGNEEFFLHPYGSGSGYPFIIENSRFIISLGQNNNPNFYVKFKSVALWHEGLQILHKAFLDWAESIGYRAYQKESLSRVDTCFDYAMTDIDFDDSSVVSLSKKNSTHKDNRTVQTISFGKGDTMIRIYDKVAEIQEKSQKTWFFDIWGVSENVWRIEWQCRKNTLKRFGIRTVEELFERQGDLLRYLATEHDSVRKPSRDRNRSRWALHALWCDLLIRIEAFNSIGIHREIDVEGLLEEKMMRNAISMYGYLKNYAALSSVKSKKSHMEFNGALKLLYNKMRTVHDPLSWEIDVEKRINKLRLGQ